jgi:hypothetical protein
MCPNWQKQGGGFQTSASRPTKRSKGSTPNERTGESGGKGLTSNANAKTRCEQSWRLATRGRFMANGYVCCTRQSFQNLSRNLFPPRRFSPPGESAAFNGTARQPSLDHGYLACTTPQPALCAVVRCSQVPRWGQAKKINNNVIISITVRVPREGLGGERRRPQLGTQ